MNEFNIDESRFVQIHEPPLKPLDDPQTVLDFLLEKNPHEDIDEWLNSPESKQGVFELGTCSGIKFITSEGIKKMEPGKRYDKNLNEL